MDEGLMELPYGLAGKIYRSALPFSPTFDPEGHLLAAYVDAGVDTVVMLAQVEEAHHLTGQDLLARYQALGYDVIQAPVPDFDVPSAGDFHAALHSTLAAVNQGRTVVIHCHAGVGRTGTFAACLAKHVFGMTGESAIAWVRGLIPKAVENDAQYQFVVDFEMPED
jgi:protein tyrosine/serine phosphatase